MITRRALIATASAATLTACTSPAAVTRRAPVEEPAAPPAPVPPGYGAITDEPFPVPAVPPGVVDPKLFRTEVQNPYPDEPAGTIIIEPDNAFLYLVQGEGRAMRYGVGLGAAGFSWAGVAKMQYRRKWPKWTPPDSMIERRPEFAPYSAANGGMPGGPGNPLGARALYLFQDGKDTLYRIHGACEPQYLGKFVSSGCVRLLDQDAIDLYDRATDGAKVIVQPSQKANRFGVVY
ncbi:L,D-transpeptidase [Oceaniglobus roseus]|uniref:L,D-transpeptidase n=1 Tax=Oceaniglobus roseus TaxID=1737570 RepID=UPI000C7F671E|nr:L,D-transpeptidase [Kandeliimicrobium roseum]